MIKTFKIFSTAALALVMAACSSEDIAQNNSPAQQEGRKVQFTATIAASNSGAGTRTEYTEVTSGDAAGTINVAWKANDEIALIHNGTKDVVKVETVNEDGSAIISGPITVGTDGEKVEVCYPAALWDAEASGAIRNATFVANTTKQDGTLKYIQDNLDVRMGEGKLKVSGDKATLSANVTLASQIAIWKLNLQDDATPTPAALKATQVTVKVDGTTPGAIAGTTTLGTATSTLYLGLDKFANQKVIIEATVGSDTYKYEKEDISLALGKYYQSTVTMAKATVAVTGVTLDEAVLRIDIYNTTETLTATVSPAEATDKTVTWKSSDETVATVDASGKITPQKAGTVTIEATAGDKTATSTVYVYDEIYAISDIDITKNALTGKSYLFTSNGTPLDTKINIEDGATVTLNGINITQQIECKGNATIILADGSTNTVTASGKAGIQIGGTGTTLTINGETAGDGTLTAKGGSDGAGIGTNKNENGGNIVINGGKVTAEGGFGAAGIGTGNANTSTSQNTCGAITINGGTVIATGGKYGAGIGTGNADYATSTNECGAITIDAGVTSVTATKGTSSPNSIGQGYNYSSSTQTCGTITIGGVVKDQNDFTGATYTYTPSN